LDPEVGAMMPVSIFTSVVLPRAVGADKPHELPGFTVRLKPETAVFVTISG
jgi:hypothetical protein